KQDGGRHIEIHVVPFDMGAGSDAFALVLFQEATAESGPAPSRGGARKSTARERDTIEKLKAELTSTRESLQTIIEEQEANNEELKSANEEIQSSNEELQS